MTIDIDGRPLCAVLNDRNWNRFQILATDNDGQGDLDNEIFSNELME